MIRPGHVVCSLLVLSAAACKKEAKPEGSGTAAAAPPPAASGAVEQKDLRAEIAGQAMAPLYGVAQPDPGKGQSYRLTFSKQPLTCAALDGGAAGDSFWIRVHEALRPDGTLTWAYGGVAFGNGGSSPAGLVALGGFQLAGGRVVGTLPGAVAHDGDGGTLSISGSFSVPVCAPLPVPALRDVADRKKTAEPIEAAGSTAQVTVAGRRIDVKGATAFGSGDGAWEVRLTGQPHGCSDEVPGDLIVVIRIGGGEPKLYLAGNWIAGSADVAPLDGTAKVDVSTSPGAVTLTLAGEMSYAGYPVALAGTVRAATCVAP